MRFSTCHKFTLRTAIQNVVCQHHRDTWMGVTTRYQLQAVLQARQESGQSVIKRGGDGHLAPGHKALPHAPKQNTPLRCCQVKLHTVCHGQKWHRRGFTLLPRHVLLCVHTHRHTYRCMHTLTVETLVRTHIPCTATHEHFVSTEVRALDGVKPAPSAAPGSEAGSRPALAAAASGTLTSLNSTAAGSPMGACQICLGRDRFSQAPGPIIQRKAHPLVVLQRDVRVQPLSS